MILNNWWNYKKAINDNIVEWSRLTIVDTGMISTSGSSCPIVVDMGWQTAWCTIVPANYAPRGLVSFLLGDGTTEPESTDYALDSDITSSFSNISVIESSVATSDDLTTTFTITGTNSTSQNLTIAEIGYVKSIYYAQTSGTIPVMMARELLDEPLIVAPDETFTITFVWKEV